MTLKSNMVAAELFSSKTSLRTTLGTLCEPKTPSESMYISLLCHCTVVSAIGAAQGITKFLVGKSSDIKSLLAVGMWTLILTAFIHFSTKVWNFAVWHKITCHAKYSRLSGQRLVKWIRMHVRRARFDPKYSVGLCLIAIVFVKIGAIFTIIL